MTETTIKPAMTPHEWREALRFPPGVTFGFGAGEGAMDRHRLAAMCLYGQPYGFTRADVEALRRVESHDPNDPNLRRIRSVADRLAALLPE